MRFNNEIRVGAVVLAGFFVIIYGYFYLRNLGLGADLYYVQVRGAATIAQGNDVRLQGVKIGQVQEVGFDPNSQQPQLTLAVRRSTPPFKLLKTYAYTIQNSGIIGESYVDIRGDYNSVVPAYSPNDDSERIPARPGGGLLSVTESANSVVKDLRKTLTKVNTTLDKINSGVLGDSNQVKLARALEGVANLTNNAAKSFGSEGVRVGLGDKRAQANLSETMANAAEASRFAQTSARNIALASEDARLLMVDVRGEAKSVLGQNKGRINTLLASLDKAATNVAGVTETLDFALKQGGFKENAQLSFQSLRRAAENVEVATGGLRRLGEDQATQDDLRTTLRALRETTEALRDTTQTVRTLVTDPAANTQIKGALGTLGETSKNLQEVTAGLKNIVADAQLQADVKAAASNLSGTLAATRAAAERVNGLLGGKRPRAATPEGAPGGAAPLVRTSATGMDFTYRYLSNRSGTANSSPLSAGNHFGDVTYNGEFFGGPFRLGLSNIGEGTDITAQTGKFLSPNTSLRYGIYRSELGAGLGFQRGRFSLEGNVYDPNNRSYNLYGGLRLTPKLELLLGRESQRGLRADALAIRVSP